MRNDASALEGGGGSLLRCRRVSESARMVEGGRRGYRWIEPSSCTASFAARRILVVHGPCFARASALASDISKCSKHQCTFAARAIGAVVRARVRYDARMAATRSARRMKTRGRFHSQALK